MADPAEADELYALPLADFTPARNELAARLRKQGDRAASDAVKTLAKPSLTAWALNQVARREPHLVARLLAAGERLVRAQEGLLAGRGQAEFREATQAQREGIGQLIQAAARVLKEAGHATNKGTLDRLEATARAAAGDTDSGELLRNGRLTADLDPTGFGGLGGEVLGMPAAPIPFRSRQAGAAAAAPAPRAPDVAAAQDEVHRLQRELDTLRKQAGEAEAAAARARQAAAKAQQAWSQAREAAARAEKAALQSHRAEQDAADELDELRAQLDNTAVELERAREILRQRRGADSDVATGEDASPERERG